MPVFEIMFVHRPRGSQQFKKTGLFSIYLNLQLCIFLSFGDMDLGPRMSYNT